MFQDPNWSSLILIDKLTNYNFEVQTAFNFLSKVSSRDASSLNSILSHLLIMPGQVKVRRLNCWHKVSAVYAVGTLVSLPCRLQIFRTLICDQTGDNYTLSWVLVMCPRPTDQSKASILVTWSVWSNQGLSHWPQELENKLRMVQDSFIHWVGANHMCVHHCFKKCPYFLN